MRTLFVSLMGVCAMAAHAGNTTPLFDGKTLNGWEGNTAIFRVEDGAIVGGSLDKSLEKNQFLAATREFSDFELRLKFKVAGDAKSANAGVQIRSRRIPDHHEMIGYQADIGQQYWGCLYDESRRKVVLAQPDDDVRAKAVKQDDWNEYRIRCVGKRIQLWLNDIQTVDYTEPDDAIEQTGLIALQVHAGPPMEVRYKDIVIEDLTAKP